jgi:uncharacterized membrane protein YuzA (DUF378 family)
MPAGTGVLATALLAFHLVARVLLVIGGVMWLVVGIGQWPLMPNAVAAAIGLAAAVQIVAAWAEPAH